MRNLIYQCDIFVGSWSGCPQEQNAFCHRMHPSLAQDILYESDESSSLSSGAGVEQISEEDEESKQERSYSKVKKMLGMQNQEVNVYETIQEYRNGKPQQVFGQIPDLDELIEMQAHTNDVRIERVLEQSKLTHLTDKQIENLEDTSTSEPPSKTSKVFGVKHEDLQMQKAHPKPSKVFGEPPPAKAFVNSPKHVKILMTE